jgi:hypothetical protein
LANKTLKVEEQITEQFLHQRGHLSVYEPCGRDTPLDFLVDGRIAVEVRRLNQNFVSADGQREGLEQQWFSIIWTRIPEFLASFHAPISDESWFLSIRFRRPVENWHSLRTTLHQKLTDFINQQARSACEITLSPNFRISLDPAGHGFPTFFVLASIVDMDKGGWVVAEMLKNINLCISEKTRKINRLKYAEWWLILVDFTGLGFNDDDYRSLREATSFGYSFDRILMIKPYDYSRAFEFYP